MQCGASCNSETRDSELWCDLSCKHVGTGLASLRWLPMTTRSIADHRICTAEPAYHADFLTSSELRCSWNVYVEELIIGMKCWRPRLPFRRVRAHSLPSAPYKLNQPVGIRPGIAGVTYQGFEVHAPEKRRQSFGSPQGDQKCSSAQLRVRVHATSRQQIQSNLYPRSLG